ncbi:hypothetical protein DPM19_28695 [Actinomadura craniellae]|uniref:Uncharacterized protein n=1 Tax=Actinomadura craniellae TaxID=2231787 RepID=A0A365H084_9ACTN|nr:hypothetical protein DPM19_28695 [Actinomadura craniellae]
MHRTLDGTRISLAGALDLGRPYTCVARIAAAGRMHEVHGGARGSALAWAADLGVRSFDEEFRVRDGRLRIGRTTVRDSRAGLAEQVLAAVWEGREHAAFTHLYHARAADAVALFDLLRPAEHTDGVTLSPARRAALAEPAALVKEVPEVGLLEISPLTERTARQLPPWPGARLASGELFRDEVEDQGVYFVLATDTALVTVLPPDEEHAAEVPDRLAGLNVEAAPA